MFARCAAVLVAGIAVVSGDSTPAPTTRFSTTIPPATTEVPEDCVCKDAWVHSEFKCNSTASGSISATSFQGCPTITALEACEDHPQQSWCKTTKATCIQQQAEAVGDGWAFCSATQQKAEIPRCTCAAVWLNGEGSHCKENQRRTRGCPTIDELNLCDPDYTHAQAWCLTNEDTCQEQVDCPDCADSDTAVGKQWAYCDTDTQLAELPDCECEDTWTPEDWAAECPDWTGQSPPSFNSCPTQAELAKCDKKMKTDQAWCKTKQTRCKQQSNSDIYPSMINDGWSYCNPTTEAPAFPTCECKDSWTSLEDKCEKEPMIFKGCPSISELKICESQVDQPYCETTYHRCEEQNYEAIDDEWVYCNHASQEADLPICECQDLWIHAEPDSLCASLPVKFRGCPSETEIAKCEPSTQPWCMTKDKKCREQTVNDGSFDDGWAYCDSSTQLAIMHASRRSSAVGLTFVFTVILCGGVFIAMMLAYRRHLKEKQVGYSKTLGGEVLEQSYEGGI